MIARCPSCNGAIDINGAPTRGPAGGEWWICLLCNHIICVNCYVKHIGIKHPEVYELKK